MRLRSRMRCRRFREPCRCVIVSRAERGREVQQLVNNDCVQLVETARQVRKLFLVWGDGEHNVLLCDFPCFFLVIDAQGKPCDIVFLNVSFVFASSFCVVNACMCLCVRERARVLKSRTRHKYLPACRCFGQQVLTHFQLLFFS